MRLFTVNDLESYTPSQDEMWTPTYSFITGEFVIGQCGCANVEIPSQCCYNSLDLEASSGVESAYEIAVDDMELYDAIPVSALNQQYCQINSLDLNALWGYQSLYVYSIEQCIDQTRCFPNGTLGIYTDVDCQELETSLIQPISYNSTTLGVVAFDWIVIDQGTAKTSWITNTPSNLLIPSYKAPIEVISLISYIISALGCIISFVRQLILWSTSRTNSKVDITFFIMNICWLVYIPLRFGFWACVFNDLLSMAFYYQIMYTLLAFSTYMTTVFTTKYFLDAIFLLNSRQKMLIYVILFIFHFSLAGCWYFSFYSSLPSVYPALNEFLNNWLKSSSYWILIMFLYNIVPLTFWLSFILARRQFGKLKHGLALGKRAFLIIFLQTLLAILYFVIDVIRKTTYLLHDDRTDLSMMGFIMFCLVYHSLLQQVLVNEIKRILYLISKPKQPIAIQVAALETTGESLLSQDTEMLSGNGSTQMAFTRQL